MAAEIVIDIVGKDNFSSTLGNFGNIMTGLKSAVDLVSGAFNALVDFGSQFTNEAIESQNAIMELEAVLKATGGAAGLTSDELQNMAGHLQKVTMFSDETIMAGQSMLLTFRNIGEDTFPRATEAMLDMAQMFGSVDSAAVQLGKALNDPIAGISALSRIGIQFTEEQKEMIENFMKTGDIASAQNIILKEVEMQIGGLAMAMGDTFAGQAEIFKNKISEVKEGIGNLILLALKPLLEYFNGDTAIGMFIETLSSSLAKLTDLIEKGVPPFQAIAMILQDLPNSTDLLSELPPVLNTLAEAFFNMQSVLDEGGSIWDALKTGFETLDINITAQDVMNWLDQLDAVMADAINLIDWHVVGDAVGDAIMSMLGTSVEGKQSEFIPALGNAFSEFFLGAMGYVDWDAVGDALIEGLKQAGGSLDTSLNSFFVDLFNIEEIKAGWRQIGEDLVSGISVGMSDGIDGLIANATRFWQNIIANAKAVLGIASPSTIFMGIGRDIVLGLIGGIGSMASSLLALVDSIVSNILNMFDPVLDLLGIGSGGTGGATGDATGTLGGSTGTAGGGTAPGTTTAGSGTVINQYFSGATINVGSWDEIAYDCIYPNPFVAATSGQLGGNGGGGGFKR